MPFPFFHNEDHRLSIYPDRPYYFLILTNKRRHAAITERGLGGPINMMSRIFPKLAFEQQWEITTKSSCFSGSFFLEALLPTSKSCKNNMASSTPATATAAAAVQCPFILSAFVSLSGGSLLYQSIRTSCSSVRAILSPPPLHTCE